jgi:hypothetical protein
MGAKKKIKPQAHQQSKVDGVLLFVPLAHLIYFSGRKKSFQPGTYAVCSINWNISRCKFDGFEQLFVPGQIKQAARARPS